MAIKASGGVNKILLPLDVELGDLDHFMSGVSGLEFAELPFEFGWRQFEYAQQQELNTAYNSNILNQPQIKLLTPVLDCPSWAETTPGSI